MTFQSVRAFLDHAHVRWRDRVLTGLTMLMALHLFVVAPLGAIHRFDLRPVSIMVAILLAAALLVLSRSLMPTAGVLAGFLLFCVSLFLRAHGVSMTLDASLEAAAWLLVGIVIVWVVSRAVFAAGRITYHRVIGAVLLYLTIGVIFVALFTLVAALAPGSFNGLTAVDRVFLPSDFVYFSFSTLTTVGYGDIVPVHPIARSLCNVEAIIGQLYPATLLARLVSLETGSRSE
jgi:hypothetical protein